MRISVTLSTAYTTTGIVNPVQTCATSRPKRKTNASERRCVRRSANGTIGPGPRFHLIRDYEASKQEMLDKRMRISVTTGQVVPWTYDPGQEIPPLPRRARLTPKEVEDRKTWCFNLELGAQRARLEAVKRLKGIGYELSEEQTIDYNYLRELLQ